MQCGIDHATYDLLTCQYTKTQELAACAVEMNLTWKLTGTERLTLHYDSAEELGQLACFKCFLFTSSRSDFRIEYIAFTFLMHLSNRSLKIPPSSPWAFEFLEISCSNAPLPRSKSCSNASLFPGDQMPPTPGNFSVASIMLRKLCM